MLDLLRTFLTVARRQSIGRPARWMIYRRTEQCFGLVAWKPPSFMMIASKSKPISPNRLSFDGTRRSSIFPPETLRRRRRVPYARVIWADSAFALWAPFFIVGARKQRRILSSHS